jgi:hypothetical protein
LKKKKARRRIEERICPKLESVDARESSYVVWREVVSKHGDTRRVKRGKIQEVVDSVR